MVVKIRRRNDIWVNNVTNRVIREIIDRIRQKIEFCKREHLEKSVNKGRKSYVEKVQVIESLNEIHQSSEKIRIHSHSTWRKRGDSRSNNSRNHCDSYCCSNCQLKCSHSFIRNLYWFREDEEITVNIISNSMTFGRKRTIQTTRAIRIEIILTRLA